MIPLEIHVERARRRLWVNRCLRQLGWTLAAASAVFALTVIVERLCHWGLPLGSVALGLVGMALAGSAVWLVLTADDRTATAQSLDQAAGLRERVTTGLYCAGNGEPFAASVYADAVHAMDSVSLRVSLPIVYPRSFSWAIASWAAALMVLALFPSYDLLGVLARERRQEDNRKAVQMTQATVQRVVERLQQIKDPQIRNELQPLETLSNQSPADANDADALRREAIKRLDRLSDRLQQQRESAQYDQIDEFKKMMRKLESDPRAESPVDKLRRGLADGDFKAAGEAIQQMKEQLARAKTEKNKDAVAEMQKKLTQLSKEMEQLARQNRQRLEEKMRQMGLSPQDAKEMLEQLSKRDPQSLKQELEKKGLDPEQIEKLMQQLQKTQGASQKCEGVAGELSQSAQAMSESSDMESGEAQAGLKEAGERLSQMEAAEQEMNDLQASMAELNKNRKELSGEGGEGKDGSGEVDSASANGKGGSGAEGSGGGMGEKGQGIGGTAERQETPTDFTPDRIKGKQSPGKVLAEFFVDGQQLKGQAQADYAKAAAVAAQEAGEAVDRDRVPRQYHKAVKEYFRDFQTAQPTTRP